MSTFESVAPGPFCNQLREMHFCYLRYMFPSINSKGAQGNSSEISVYIVEVFSWLDGSHYLYLLVFPKGRCPLFMLFIQESQLLLAAATTAYI